MVHYYSAPFETLFGLFVMFNVKPNPPTIAVTTPMVMSALLTCETLIDPTATKPIKTEV